MVDATGLIDLGFKGQRFTWGRGRTAATRVEKRIDRSFVNVEARLRWPNASTRHLPKFSSDHTPLLISLESRTQFDRGRRPFRFEAIWASHDQFLKLVQDSWDSTVSAFPALEGMRLALLKWNKEVFGHVQAQKNTLLLQLDRVQTSIGLGPTEELLAEEATIQSQLEEVLLKEEMLWKQKSREMWLREGDRNTKFFHLSTIIRCRFNRVDELMDDNGATVSNKEALETLVTSFFKGLYSIPVNKVQPISTLHGRFPVMGEIGRMSGFEVTKDLGSYLGIPILHKPMNRNTFQHIILKMKNKLAGWKSKVLSMAGRITLCNSVLCSIPVYSMASLKLPTSVCKELNRLNKAFIWGSWEDRRRIHLVKWSEVCKPKKLGGLGVKDMISLNSACCGKLAWRFMKDEEGLWAEILRCKYIRDDYSERVDCSAIWRSVKAGLQKVLTQGMIWQLGGGDIIRFWSDVWVGSCPLKDVMIGATDDATLQRTVQTYWDVN
ncbi:hypothetical protein V2J09_002318 [Rumex salicifolius]